MYGIPAIAFSDRSSRNIARCASDSDASDAAQDFFTCLIQVEFTSAHQHVQAGTGLDVQNLLHSLLRLRDQASDLLDLIIAERVHGHLEKPLDFEIQQS